MLSSTSSSNERLPNGAWKTVLLGALLLAATFVAVIESRLAVRGYRSAVADTEDLWARERRRASALGDKALILVGASRVQLDTDLAVLRSKTGREPVQLAIDGSSFVPVLRDLAADPTVTGTVIVDFNPRVIGEWDADDAAAQYVADFENHRNRFAFNAEASEAFLTGWRSMLLRSYADGATPLNSLLKRVLPAQPVQQYLITRPDRSRLADYHRVPMPDFYLGRVQIALGRTLDFAPGTTTAAALEALHEEVLKIAPADNADFVRHLADFEAQVRRIEARGGRVFVVTFPTSGLVRDINDRRYPRAMFWDALAAKTGSRTLHFDDNPALRAFQCPDGSHLDYRDRAAFTSELANALGLSRDAPDAAAVSASGR